MLRKRVMEAVQATSYSPFALITLFMPATLGNDKERHSKLRLSQNDRNVCSKKLRASFGSNKGMVSLNMRILNELGVQAKILLRETLWYGVGARERCTCREDGIGAQKRHACAILALEPESDMHVAKALEPESGVQTDVLTMLYVNILKGLYIITHHP